MKARTSTPLPEPITYAGYAVRAPGFDSESFAAGIDRALSDGLNVQPGRAPKTWYVYNPATRGEYAVSPAGCTCAAGKVRHPCKHSALVLLLDAITESRV